MGDVRLRESSVIEPEKKEMSVEMRSVNPGDQSYNWNGSQSNAGRGGNEWSYSQYMREQEEQEEEIRRDGGRGKVEIITID